MYLNWPELVSYVQLSGTDHNQSADMLAAINNIVNSVLAHKVHTAAAGGLVL